MERLKYIFYVLTIILTISLSPAQATTLDDFLNDTTGNWTMYVLDASAAVVGQCSAFTFGDISDPNGPCTYTPDDNNINQVGTGGFKDNAEDNAGTFFLPGGDGVLGNDRVAGTLDITKTGRNTFSITGFQIDPYLATAGGTFKTTMTTMGFAGAGGTVADNGDMALDLTGRTGIAFTFRVTLGEQLWNLDTHGLAAGGPVPQPFCEPGTGVYELLISGSDTNLSCGDGTPNTTVTGRPLGDADDGEGRGVGDPGYAGPDGILDAVLVSAGNVGGLWQFFDGTPYSEAFNIRVRPAAAPDAGTIVETPITITPKCTRTSVNPISGVQTNGSNFTMLKPTGEVFGGTNDIDWDWDEMTFNVDETDPVSEDPMSPNYALMHLGSAADFKFFGFVWSAHHLRVYQGPGTFTFDSTCTVAQLEGGLDCSGNLLPAGEIRDLTMTLGPLQIGVHMLFDWSATANIDVVNIYDFNTEWANPDGRGGDNDIWSGEKGFYADETLKIRYVSTDNNGDGKNGVPMPDGPFQGYYANFNLNPFGWCAPEPYNGKVSDTKISGCTLSPTPTKLAHHADWLLLLGFLAVLRVYRRKIVIARK